MTNDDEQNDRQDLVDLLKTYGWNEEKANAFLDDKVGILRLQVPGKCLLDVVQLVCQEGIPTGTISIDFLVPNGNRDAFRNAAEAAVAKKGGFVFTPEEKAALVGVKPETVH